MAEFWPCRNNDQLSEGDVVTVVKVAKPSLIKHNLDRCDVYSPQADSVEERVVALILYQINNDLSR